tara:strand:+ start:1153 stop:2337 length:1185 start_codon:yes stop_codon:yes gene_type:complete
MLETFVDFGNYKTRLGVFNKTSSSKDYFIEKKIYTKINLENENLQVLDKLIKELIYEAEKKINTHIKDLNIMLDLSNFNPIDLSLKKNYEGEYINADDIQILLQESKQIVQENNQDKKIIHMIVKKFIFDEKVYFEAPEEDIKCKNLTLEIKFICYPNTIINNIENIFKNNDILVNSISCSTYIKSLNYNKFFKNHENKIFLDIGFKKTCLAVFYKNVLTHLNSVPVGGNHITSDISKIFKLNEENSENIKKSFNKTETIFFDNNEKIKNNLETDLKLITKDISHDLLKKVIYARVEEIINLSFQKIEFDGSNKENKYILVFIGDGSKILNKNAIYLENKYDFINEMIFFEENVESICRSAQNFANKNYSNEVSFVSKKPKKIGFFEKLFDLFK